MGISRWLFESLTGSLAVTGSSVLHGLPIEHYGERKLMILEHRTLHTVSSLHAFTDYTLKQHHVPPHSSE